MNNVREIMNRSKLIPFSFCSFFSFFSLSSFSSFLSTLFVSLILIPALGSAQEFKVSNIEINQTRWGWRQLIVRVENHRADSVRLELVLYTLYQDHHVSGLDRAMYDTSFVVGPGQAGGYKLEFEMPGSFHKRLVSRAFVYWEYSQPDSGQPARDSTFQSFNNVFFPSDSAFEYANNKYLFGPIGCIDDNELLAFDYPRIMLYMLGQGVTINEINERFVIEPKYSKYLTDKAELMGLVKQVSDSGLFSSDFVSISERQGYEIKSHVDWAVEVFRQWYEREGEKELTKALKESGIDGPALSFPSVRMLVMLTQLEMLSETALLLPNVSNSVDEASFRQKPFWIFQGGEFFAPKLSMMNFVQGKRRYWGTFRYAPVQKYEKSPIDDLKRAVADRPDMTPNVKASSLQRAITRMGNVRSFSKIRDVINDWIERSVGHIDGIDNQNLPYLADYFYRYILGELFIEMQKTMPYDCVRVEYDK